MERDSKLLLLCRSVIIFFPFPISITLSCTHTLIQMYTHTLRSARGCTPTHGHLDDDSRPSVKTGSYYLCLYHCLRSAQFAHQQVLLFYCFLWQRRGFGSRIDKVNIINSNLWTFILLFKLLTVI